MTRIITEQYRAQLMELHGSPRGIGAGGAGNAPQIVAMANTHDMRRILDYGCGQGKLKEVLRDFPFHVYEYDPAVAGHQEVPADAKRGLDLVVCTDVLEHVEPECLSGVVLHLRSLESRWYYFVIALKPSSKDLPDGRNAHLIVQDAWWWGNELRAIGGTIASWYIRRSRNEPIEAVEVHIWIRRK